MSQPGEAPVDVRLVVVDMDGTLLDGHGRIPAGLWPLLGVMRERGIVFAPASGRQYATLATMFADAPGALLDAVRGAAAAKGNPGSGESGD